MSPSAPSRQGSDALLAEIVEEFTNRVQAGESVDVEAYIHKHPEHAERLRQLLPALALLDDLGRSLSSAANGAAGQSSEDTLSGVLGDFRILREVGKGGMGVVYEAEQISLRRRVALKVLPFAATMDARHLQRFHNEAQAAACLHHTNIVPVFFVGSERGVHFYAMQYINGQPLSELIRQLRQRENKTPTPAEAAASTPMPAADMTPLTGEGGRGRDYFRKVAELGVQAAEALEHAHQLGIVHRDIKPANLLLDARGNLWVTDFGLAHMQHGENNLTMTGQAVGTPRYMSPEQALAKRVVLDHRTDIYSLGVTLYELLTLRPAFSSDDRQELLRQIAFEEPPRPRKLNRAIPTELETIILKTMEKEAADRYGTAQEMAKDLQRHLRNEPIWARRPTVCQRIVKWSKRHRAFVWSGMATLGATFIALATTTALVWQAERETQGALKREADALTRERMGAHLLRIAAADRAWWIGRVDRAEEILDECPANQRHFEWYYLKRLCHKELRTLSADSAPVWCVAINPDGQRLAFSTDDNVKICRIATGETLLTIPGASRTLWFSPDGSQLAGAIRGADEKGHK
jgi:serine/threonine protein kinase